MTIRFEPFESKHLSFWEEWVELPHVKNVWFVDGYETADYIHQKISGNGYCYPFVIIIDNTPVGYIQTTDLFAYRNICPKSSGVFANEKKGTFCLDLFIADEEFLNKGFGTKIIEKFTNCLLHEFNAQKILIDPAESNKRAIRCYEKAGYKYIRTAHDGITNCHIMEYQRNILKSHWERGSKFVRISQDEIQDLIKPYTAIAINNIKLLQTGCANTNYLLNLKNGDKLIFRIYVRDQAAITREQHIYKLVPRSIPVPKILYANDSKDILPYPFALLEFLEGLNMREVILSGDLDEIGQCAESAGKLCAKLRKVHFPSKGFFDSNGNIVPLAKDQEFKVYATNLLNLEDIRSQLGNDRCEATLKWIIDHDGVFTQEEKPNLTHADFDPANMLVSKVRGKYVVTALLDWEFTFSGSYLMDVGQFLRYAHKLPKSYSSCFLSGLASDDKLPDDWKIKSQALDLLCLLTLIQFNSSSNKKNIITDVINLIDNIVGE